jgi:hypothetical protein
VAVGVNAGVHVFTLQTRAFIGNDPNAPTNQGAGNVHAAGSVVIAANDASGSPRTQNRSLAWVPMSPGLVAVPG